MLSVKKSVVTGVVLLSVSLNALAEGPSTFDLIGSLVSKGDFQLPSAKERDAMELARNKFLNKNIAAELPEGVQSEEWDSAEFKVKGRFTLDKDNGGRYVKKATSAQCLRYVHTTFDKAKKEADGSFSVVVGSTSTGAQYPLAIRGYACLENGSWKPSSSEGLTKASAAQATPATPAAATQPAAQQPAAPKAQAPATESRANSVMPVGEIGPDYRFDHPHLLPRIKLGEVVLDFKKMQIQIDEALDRYGQENKLEITPKMRNEMEPKWAEKYAEGRIAKKYGLVENNSYISVDQLAIIVKELKTEAAKKAVIVKYDQYGRIDGSVGDKSSVLSQFNSARTRNEIRPLLSKKIDNTQRRP